MSSPSKWDEANRHVVIGTRMLFAHRMRIAGLGLAGHDVTAGQAMLQRLEWDLDQMRDGRDRLLHDPGGKKTNRG